LGRVELVQQRRFRYAEFHRLMILACGDRCGHCVCDLRDGQPLLDRVYRCCRTLLAFSQSIKPDWSSHVEPRRARTRKLWKWGGVRNQALRDESAVFFFTGNKTQPSAQGNLNLEKRISLVVVIGVVETWKTSDGQCFCEETRSGCEWRIVRTEENSPEPMRVTGNKPDSFTIIHTKSARFANFLHTKEIGCRGCATCRDRPNTI
jgi:hypothetical protein